MGIGPDAWTLHDTRTLFLDLHFTPLNEVKPFLGC